MRRQCKGLKALLPKNYQELGWLYSPTHTQTSSNGLSFCCSHKYGSSWRSATPPSVPSCVPVLLLHWQELPLSKGKALLTRGQLHLSSAVCAPRCHPALHIQDPAALGLPSHTWGRLQNQSVGLIHVVYTCNALNSNTCQPITEVVTVQNFCGYSEHSIIYCKLHHN